MPKKSARKTEVQPWLGIILIILLLVASGLAWYGQRLQTKSTLDPSSKLTGRTMKTAATPNPRVTSAPTPTPTPTALLHGKETYTISQGSSWPGPRISQVILQPLDPTVGQTQVITVKASFTSPIDQMIVSITTDHRTQTFPASLIQGTSASGSWQMNWQVNDSYSSTYLVEVKSVAGNQTTPITLTIRSPQ